MKLTFLIDSMDKRAGMERVTSSVANGLARRGHDVDILTVRGKSSAFELDPRVSLHSLGLPPGSLRLRAETWPLMRRIRRRLLAHRPDVLIAVDPFLSLFAFPAVQDLGIHRVAWEHFNLFTTFNMRSRQLGRRLATVLADDIVTLTERDAAQWRAAFPRARARIRAITNPLPFARPEHNLYDPGHRTLLAVGRLDPQKGFDLLTQAWGQIEQQVPEWQLKIIGSGADEAQLRAQAAQLGLRRWSLTPDTAQVQDEYRAAGAFCLSSRYEGLGMVLMESQAYGVPAVAFDCPIGPAELLVGGGGVLVPPEDVPGLAQALKTLLLDQPAREAMSTRAHEASRHFEADAVLGLWDELLQRAKNRRAPSARPAAAALSRSK